ncbi:MAG: ATP-dependent DNA ligase, partial [Williamsia herbipolensis]|nr:ATP-dependent DNA ligase [Williamsia herbipolensis]
MAKAPATTVTAGGREVRVSSPDRVVYEATDATPEVTKLQVCEYFAAMGDPLMNAIGHRPLAMERWPDGWREGMRLATSTQDREADGFYQKRLPKGAPDWLETVRVYTPGKRPIDELCPHEPAAAVWAAQMGTLTFHPWPCTRDDVDHPDELRIDIDPQPGTTFTDARRVALVAGELLEELGLRGYPKTSGNRGIHVYVRIEPTRSFEDVRHAAIGFGRELERRDDSVTT